MKQLPKEIANQIQPGLKIAWWGRRAVYEIVEEVSESLFRVWVLVSYAGIISYYTWGNESRYGLEGPWMYWGAVLLVALAFAQHGIVEYFNWRNEIYVVARDDNNGNGRVYKFWGWLNKRHIDEPISPSSPTISFDQPLFYRMWGAWTQEEMARISLRSANHTFLDGQRISPRFEKEIQRVRGHQPVEQENFVSDLQSISEIKQAMIDGLLTEREAKNATRHIVNKAVFGG